MKTVTFDRDGINSHNVVGYLADLFARRGAEAYMGEAVSMAQHMLQAAQAAEESNAQPALIVAALLHDVGHFANDLPESELMSGTDNFHEVAGADFLDLFFPASVSVPVRFHVDAKRYLCRVDQRYFSQLSDASIFTLSVQGGPMSEEEVTAFEAMPHASDSVQLRRWDDLGKVAGHACPAFGHYEALVHSLVRG